MKPSPVVNARQAAVEMEMLIQPEFVESFMKCSEESYSATVMHDRDETRAHHDFWQRCDLQIVVSTARSLRQDRR